MRASCKKYANLANIYLDLQDLDQILQENYPAIFVRSLQDFLFLSEKLHFSGRLQDMCIHLFLPYSFAQ